MAQEKSTMEITRLGAARIRASHLKAAVATCTRAVEDLFFRRYLHVSRGGPETQTLGLSQRCMDQVNRVFQDVANCTGDTATASREILEQCYGQAVDVCRTLNRDDYYCYRYNLPIEYFPIPRAQWIEYWINQLRNKPHGPTLFNPFKKNLARVRHLTDVPRYLFRAFDESSSGLSNSHVVASQQSISSSAIDRELSKVDLLSKWLVEAAIMLYEHLEEKDCFGVCGSDNNLMSWSSSLLHVVQYAIWRSHHHAAHARQIPQVRICAVDTRKFPVGQFARDRHLILLNQDIQIHKDLQEFFNFRLNRREYDNGEFLSQGELNYAGRSCVFTLDQLLNGGLHDLYPELSEETEKWTGRTLRLRSKWSRIQYYISSMRFWEIHLHFWRSRLQI
ncbi:hypothetical protein V8F06_008545 [Rhypophila decipiens]